MPWCVVCGGCGAYTETEQSRGAREQSRGVEEGRGKIGTEKEGYRLQVTD
jgi:hypothetical protein